MVTKPTLRVEGLSKSYPGIVALEDVTLTFQGGGIHGIVGENGAGKSTFIKILAGGTRRDTGKIFIDDQEVEINDPLEARRLGIGTIYQEFTLVPSLTVAENVFLGREPRFAGILVDRRRLRRDAADLLQPFHLKISPSTIVEDLPTAQQQLVEITKAISLKARILIMDEPTASLTEHEITNLHGMIRLICQQGATILYISHKLDEIFSLCETVTVLRDGRVVNVHKVSELDKDTVIREMVGRELSTEYSRRVPEYGPELLRVENLSKRGIFQDISFSVRAGEIVGFFGLLGAKRTDVLRAIFGADQADSGRLIVRGKELSGTNSPSLATTKKMALIPEDRKRHGLLLSATVWDNASIVMLQYLEKGVWLYKRSVSKAILPNLKRLRVKYPHFRSEAGTLSGGNQQKLVIAKWLSSESDILLIDEPTRGVDVGAKAEIHRAISDLANEGKAVVLVSSELPEVLGLSDRLIVMHEGKITGQLDSQEYDPVRIMRMAAGQ